MLSAIDPRHSIEQLRGITCCPAWDSGTLVRSSPDAVALALERHLAGHEADSSQSAKAPVQMELLGRPVSNGNGSGYTSVRKCPDCNAPVVFQEGCLMCVACGWNKCE